MALEEKRRGRRLTAEKAAEMGTGPLQATGSWQPPEARHGEDSPSEPQEEPEHPDLDLGF